jgi:3-deoxy-7-phosphoheptulonate synthase / chorismate mutase
MDAANDPIVADHREQITALDTEILNAVNRRILLVGSLHAHKREQGYPTIDSGRESQLLDELRRHNTGPISDEALERLERLILELCTAEAARIAARELEA